ncbi:unnamed protein product, partial [Effrenium voratum]
MCKPEDLSRLLLAEASGSFVHPAQSACRCPQRFGSTAQSGISKSSAMKLTSILAICLGGAKALNPGDCAFTAVFADEPSQFGLLLLKDVEEEPVFVTDHGLMADGSLSRVGSVTKQHKGRVAAGTVLKSADFQGEGGSISGDHLVAYTGSAESPTLLCAVHMEDIS